MRLPPDESPDNFSDILCSYFFRVLEERALTSDAKNICTSSLELYDCVLESHAAKVATWHAEILANDRIRSLLQDKKIADWSEEALLPLPYILKIWQRYRGDPDEFYLDRYEHASVPEEVRLQATEHYHLINELPVDELLNQILNEWKPTESFVLDCCALFCIWVAAEIGVHGEGAQHIKLLKCATPDSPFLVTWLSNLCLCDGFIQSHVDDSCASGKCEGGWGDHFNTVDYIIRFYEASERLAVEIGTNS